MGIAINPAMDSYQSSKRNAVLIPELAFMIQQHLDPHDLAIASRVCRNWQEAWTPFLYYAVRYRHRQHSYHANLPLSTHSPPELLLLQQYAMPFLNLDKYGRWIKVLQASNLVVAHHYSGAVTSCSTIKAATAAALSPTTAGSIVPCSPSPVQDHLLQIQACASLNLTELHITKTVMSLARLDDLLSSLPLLKVFKFEIVNKVEPITTSWHSRSGSNGYMQHHQSNLLLKKPKRISLEGLEPEAVRIIARRLSSNLERLELIFSVTGTIVASAFEELFANCGSTLKTLSLTRAKICQWDYSRELSASYQAEISALLASLSGTSISPLPTAAATTQPLQTTTAASSPATMSSLSSYSSITSAYSTSASSTSSLQRDTHSYSKVASALESLSLNSCTIEDRECAWLLKCTPGLRELHLHDCRLLDEHVVQSILTYTPLLETISLSSVPHIHPDTLQLLFRTNQTSAGSGPSTSTGKPVDRAGLQLKNVRLAYLLQLDDTVMKTLAAHQGPSLVTLSLQWCPHVTDEGIIPIFKHCEKLQDLSLYLSKPTLNIFKDLTEPTGTEKKLWACAQTLERLEIGGQMFVDRIRTSSEHLHPQLYHHMSPNPHHIRNGSTPQVAGINSINSSSSQSCNIIRDPYSVAHHQGYPMYHLWRYERYSNPFTELQAQLETLPRLAHLGISAKGVEHLIQKGFGPKVRLQSLKLMNQQGRFWSPKELADLLRHMPQLRTLSCEKNTILTTPASCRRDTALHKRQEEMRRLLQQHRIELVQSVSSPGMCARDYM